MQETLTIKVHYLSDKIQPLEYIDGKSDWIDLRAAEDVALKAGDFKLIPLGIAMQLPKGYEAHIIPRSSTFKNFGVIQANHMGMVDESYCGDNDQWFFPAIACGILPLRPAIAFASFALRSTSPSCFSSQSIRWATLIEAVSDLLGSGKQCLSILTEELRLML